MSPKVEDLVNQLAEELNLEVPTPSPMSDKADALATVVAHLIDRAVGEDMGNDVQHTWAWVVASRTIPILHQIRHVV